MAIIRHGFASGNAGSTPIRSYLPIFLSGRLSMNALSMTP